eukprot:2841282-Rhodomonas_salina.3
MRDRVSRKRKKRCPRTTSKAADHQPSRVNSSKHSTKSAMSAKSLLALLIGASLPSVMISSLSHTSPQFLRQWKQQPRVGLSRFVPKNLPERHTTGSTAKKITPRMLGSISLIVHSIRSALEGNDTRDCGYQAPGPTRMDVVGFIRTMSGADTGDAAARNVISTQEFCVKPQNFTISAKIMPLPGKPSAWDHAANGAQGQ